MIYEEMTLEQLRNGLVQDLAENAHIGYWFGRKGIDMIIESIEKQIPKKPTIARFFDKIEYDCPHCYSVVGEDRYICKGTKITNVFREHHCTCGQSIDWSNNND